MSAPAKPTAARRPAAPKTNSRVTQYVDQQLERTRRQVKSTDLIAAGLLLIVMVVGFLLLAAIVDAWVITLTPLMRWIALLGLVAGCASMMMFSIWPLLTKKINPDYAAKMLEDSKPGFRNSVLNYVWFRKKPDDIRSAVFDAVARQAAVDLNSVPADSSVDRSKVIRLGFWLVGVTAAFIVYFMLSPKNPFQTLNRVMFPSADLAKPAVVTISDVTPGNASVFFGDQIEVTAKVYGQHSPEDVQLIYSTNDGRQSGQVMVMQPDPATPRQYKLDLTKNTGGLRESLEYEIVARDGQSGKFEIKVAPRPAIAIESIQIQPPKYTKLKPQTTLQGAIDGVEGAMVVLSATANLEIEKATIELLNQLPTAPNENQKFKLVRAPLDMKVESKSARRTFQLTLDTNREKPMATHYRLNFRSVTGKSPETPNVYPIRIIPDLAPELEVRSPTAPESKVAANGRMAVVAMANDLDYEISFIQINVEHRGNEIRSKKLPLKVQAENGRKAQARFEIKPQELGLSVGDQAIFYLTAGDNRTTYFNDDPAPNVTRSKNYSFTVTEPNKSSDAQSNPNEQNPPPSGDDKGEESQDPSNQSDEKSDGGESSDTPDKGDETSNSGDESSEEGDPSGGSEAGDENMENDPSQDSQPDKNDPNQPPEGSPDDQSEQGSDGTSDPKSSEGNPSESPEADGPEGNQDSESAPEDGGSGTSERSPQDSASKSSGGSKSDPDGAEPENKGDGAGGDQRPSDSDPNTDASDARQGDSPSGNDVSDTAPEKRDENLTEGEEQLSDDASQAEQIRQLDKLLSENPEMREKPAGEEQANPEQNLDSDDPSKGEDPSDPESPQPNQNGDPASVESEQSPEPSNQSDPSQQQQNPEAEQDPNPNGAESKGSDSQNPNDSQETDSPDSKSSSESNSEGSPKPDEGSSSNKPKPEQPNKQQKHDGASPQPGSEPDAEKSDSGEPSDPDSKAPGESESNDPGQPGSKPAKQEGQPADSGQPSEQPSSPSEQPSLPSDKPPEGSPSGKPSDSPASPGPPGGPASEYKPGEQPENEGARQASKGDVGTETLMREKENLEYSQKKIDLLLDPLRSQRDDPNEELLKKMNWDKQDLNDFIDSWDEMRAAAGQGDVQAKREYERRLRSTGLRPDAKRRSVTGNEQEAGVLNQDGVINEAPPEERHNFNLFLQDLQRARP